MKPVSTRTILVALAALAAASAFTLPAIAQPHDHGYGAPDRNAYGPGRWEHRDNERGGYNLERRQQRLDWRIERGLRDGSLTRREARRLREAFNEIAYVEARYRRDGLSGWERADLDRRFDRLEDAVRHERRDRDYGYGYHR